MTVTEEIEEIKEEMCNKYCHYPTSGMKKRMVSYGSRSNVKTVR